MVEECGVKDAHDHVSMGARERFGGGEGRDLGGRFGGVGRVEWKGENIMLCSTAPKCSYRLSNKTKNTLIGGNYILITHARPQF